MKLRLENFENIYTSVIEPPSYKCKLSYMIYPAHIAKTAFKDHFCYDFVIRQADTAQSIDCCLEIWDKTMDNDDYTIYVETFSPDTKVEIARSNISTQFGFLDMICNDVIIPFEDTI